MRNLCVLALSLALSGCYINTTGYELLSKAERQHVVVCGQPISQLADDGNTYQINAQQLKDYLKQTDHAVVYNYKSFCRSEHCVAPRLAMETCRKKGYRLVVVANTYDGLSTTRGLAAPSLAIDRKFYKTNKYPKLSRLFYDELTNTTQKERGYYSFLLFERGRYVKSFESVYDLPDLHLATDAHTPGARLLTN